MKSIHSLLISAACIATDSLVMAGQFREALAEKTVTLFENSNTFAENPQAGGDPSQSFKWELISKGYYDEDKGYTVMEWRNELTLPILSTDVVTFHIEFDDGAPTSTFFRDGFDCSVSRNSYNNFWVTADPIDYYVRNDETSAAVVDFNNSVSNDGQDWFVYRQDE